MRLSFLLVCISVTVSAAPKCPSVAEAAALAGEPSDLSAKLTPPLPVSWPPSGSPAVRYFDFRSEALPTGVVAYSLESPSVEITIPLDGTPVKRRTLGKRTRLGRSEGVSNVQPDAALLLMIICENRMPN
jgi:hypothetical protein